MNNGRDERGDKLIAVAGALIGIALVLYVLYVLVYGSL
jgi:hypothetical protein